MKCQKLLPLSLLHEVVWRGETNLFSIWEHGSSDPHAFFKTGLDYCSTEAFKVNLNKDHLTEVSKVQGFTINTVSFDSLLSMLPLSAIWTKKLNLFISLRETSAFIVDLLNIKAYTNLRFGWADKSGLVDINRTEKSEKEAYYILMKDKEGNLCFLCWNNAPRINPACVLRK